MGPDMPSRRRRKRGRRQAHAGRGDRLPAPVLPGLRRSRVRWRDATPGELRLLLSAICQDWPVPAERRGPIMAEVLAARDGKDARQVLRLARIALAADRSNMGM